MSSLDAELKKNKPSTNGDMTLRFFDKIGMSMGVIPNKKVPDLIQEYVFVPYPNNVYTYYSPYIRDFGIWYACLILFVFGAVHTWVYKKALRFLLFSYFDNSCRIK